VNPLALTCALTRHTVLRQPKASASCPAHKPDAQAPVAEAAPLKHRIPPQGQTPKRVHTVHSLPARIAGRVRTDSAVAPSKGSGDTCHTHLQPTEWLQAPLTHTHLH